MSHIFHGNGLLADGPDSAIDQFNANEEKQQFSNRFARSMKREYESFVDESYYNMTCVRRISNKDFNSSESWHFSEPKDAEMFLKLLNIAL